MAEKIFQALASTPRRKILAYLSAAEMTAGEIADRFDMSKPAISKHLQVLENAGLVRSQRRKQFVIYTINKESLANTLNGYLQRVCPVSRPLKRESERVSATRRRQQSAN